MTGRRRPIPLVIHGGQFQRLERVPFGEGKYDEGWLQGLLYKHPELIPAGEIEPVFGPPIPVARELPTAVGPADILCVSPAGYLTLVETKLWKNPQARREVVAQIVDYAAQLSRWSYDELNEAVRRRRPELKSSNPLHDVVAEQLDVADETTFVDTVTRNLRAGRFLLLVIGDGIHESVEQLAEVFANVPQLGFALALVEIGLYRMHDAERPGETLFVQPSVVTRTREVVRAVVELRVPATAESVAITVSKEPPGELTPRSKITEGAFYEALATRTSPENARTLRAFLDEVRKLAIDINPQTSSLSLHYIEPLGGDLLSLGSIRANGEVDMYHVRNSFWLRGFDENIAVEYLKALTTNIPGATVVLSETKKGDHKSEIRVAGRHVRVDELLSHADVWRQALADLVDAVNALASSRS